MFSFKAFLIGTTAALAGTAALAADLPSRRAPYSYDSVPVFTWTGFYAGLNVGAAIDNSSTSNLSYGPAFGSFLDSTTAGYRKTQSDVGFTGGVQAGYNYQWGAIVTGVEADINAADVSSRRNGSGSLSFGGATGTEALSSKSSTDYFGTLRGRLGYVPMERMMVYGTGGLAYGDVNSRTSAAFTTNVPGLGSFSSSYTGGRSETQLGYAVGAGIEYALTDNVTLKGEYLYVDLGRTTNNVVGSGASSDSFTTRNGTEFSVARAGLNWKFNGF